MTVAIDWCNFGKSFDTPVARASQTAGRFGFVSLVGECPNAFRYPLQFQLLRRGKLFHGGHDESRHAFLFQLLLANRNRGVEPLGDRRWRVDWHRQIVVRQRDIGGPRRRPKERWDAMEADSTSRRALCPAPRIFGRSHRWMIHWRGIIRRPSGCCRLYRAPIEWVRSPAPVLKMHPELPDICGKEARRGYRQRRSGRQE